MAAKAARYAVLIIDISSSEIGGRSRTRTYDPLIKSRRFNEQNQGRF